MEIEVGDCSNRAEGYAVLIASPFEAENIGCDVNLFNQLIPCADSTDPVNIYSPKQETAQSLLRLSSEKRDSRIWLYAPCHLNLVSAAMLIILAAEHRPLPDVVDYVMAKCPNAIPNPLLCFLGDELLGLHGELFHTIKTFSARYHDPLADSLFA